METTNHLQNEDDKMWLKNMKNIGLLLLISRKHSRKKNMIWTSSFSALLDTNIATKLQGLITNETDHCCGSIWFYEVNTEIYWPIFLYLKINITLTILISLAGIVSFESNFKLNWVMQLFKSSFEMTVIASVIE